MLSWRIICSPPSPSNTCVLGPGRKPRPPLRGLSRARPPRIRPWKSEHPAAHILNLAMSVGPVSLPASTITIRKTTAPRRLIGASEATPFMTSSLFHRSYRTMGKSGLLGLIPSETALFRIPTTTSSVIEFVPAPVSSKISTSTPTTFPTVLY